MSDQINDYDRVVTQLKRMAGDKDANHADRMAAAIDLAELLELGTHWQRVFDANPLRPGKWFNLAILSWAGMDTKRRLPFVFNALGLRRLND